jgi:chitodextrinase
MRALALALALLALAPASAPAQDRTRPSTPQNLRVTATATTSVSLAWNASTDNSGRIASYRIREGLFGQRTSTSTTFTWTGLQPNSTYRFTVSAVDPSGNRSSESNQVTVRTLAAAPPATPANLRLVSAGVNTLSFAWDAAAGATRYELASNTGGWHNVFGGATSHTVSWLFPDTAYTFTVRAFNDAGTASAPSAPITARTLRDTTAPSVPAGLTGTAVSPSEIVLTWTPSSDDSNYISYNVDLGDEFWPHMLPGDNQTMTVRALRDETAYTFSVKAYDSSGNVSEAAQITVSTPAKDDTVAPPPPVNLTATRVTSHSVELAWGPWSGHPDNFEHEIHMDGGHALDVHGDWRYFGMLIPRGEIRHLEPGSTHTFTVRNRDEAGNVSEPSNAVTVTFPPSTDTTPPAAPTGLEGDTSPHCAFAFFNTFGAGPESGGDIEIFEDGRFAGVYREEAFMTSFGRRTYTARYVDRAGNASGHSPAIVLDHGMRC